MLRKVACDCGKYKGGSAKTVTPTNRVVPSSLSLRSRSQFSSVDRGRYVTLIAPRHAVNGDVRAIARQTAVSHTSEELRAPTMQSVTENERLTWEQYQAGEPCRGCGRPMRDATPWTGSGKGLIHLSEEERAQYDSEEQLFNLRHADCHAHRWTVEGSLTTHCGKCCPPPPMSPEQTARIAALLYHALRDQQELRGRK